MPVPLRTTNSKAEAKYNVTTDFPSLGLHHAAATGNLGLVEYALEHGQPINSVLDGVLPLHAACAGGNEQVVKLLIEHGADVNAPRLPRRYSNDKNRDTSAPIVGTSGSAPLHFAAANGNTQVVLTLLLHGAHPDRPDKHGVTPEMLARQHGWLECAQVLQDWVLNKDRDLREREGVNGKTAVQEAESSPSRRRLHVKQSIDNALNMLRPSTAGLSEGYLRPQPLRTPTSPNRRPATANPSGRSEEFIIQPISPSDDGRHSPNPPGFDPSARRPSLPQLYPGDSSTTPSRGRKGPSPSPAVLRRPRSAGNGSMREREFDYGHKRVNNKYSLLNLFKKGQPGEILPDGTVVPLPDSPPPLPPTLFPSSIPPGSPQTSSQSISAERPSLEALTPSSSHSPLPRPSQRIPRSSDASTKSRNIPPPTRFVPSGSPSGPPISLAVDLHNAIHQQVYGRRDRSRSGTGARLLDRPGTGTVEGEVVAASPASNTSSLSRLNFLRKGHNRDRSGSAGSLSAAPQTPSNRNGAIFDDDVLVIPRSTSSNDSALLTARQGILRSNGRANSPIGQNVPPLPTPQTPGNRSLRFESNSNSSLQREEPISLKSTNSAGSMNQRTSEDSRYGDAPSPHEVQKVPESAPPIGRNRSYLPQFDDDDEELEDYGQPLERGQYTARSALMATPIGVTNLPHSSSQTSLSPIDTAANGAPLKAEFPFSLNYPPVDEGELVPPPNPLRKPARSRDSVGSMGTPESRSKSRLSVGAMTSGSSRVDTPSPIPSRDEITSKPASKRNSLTASTGSPSKHSVHDRRPHVPPDIDIVAISSHAQAEALVQRAQQDILELAQQVELEVPGSTIPPNKTPLSARLAAYGESLAIERKMREQKRMDGGVPVIERVDPVRVEAAYTVLVKKTSKEALVSLAAPRTSLGRDRSPARPIPSPVPPQNSFLNLNGRQYGVERQLSVGHTTGAPPVKLRLKGPKRPATADAFMSRRNNTSFGNEYGMNRSHHSTRSTAFTGPVIEDLDETSENQPPALSQHHHPLFDSNGRRYQPPRHRPDPSDSDLEEDVEGEFEGSELSRISSLDDLDSASRATHDEKPFGYSTSSLVPPPSIRNKQDRVRSANKLTRMGFSPAELAGRVHQQPSTIPPAKPFNAIKSFFKSNK